MLPLSTMFPSVALLLLRILVRASQIQLKTTYHHLVIWCTPERCDDERDDDDIEDDDERDDDDIEDDDGDEMTKCKEIE